MSRQSTTATPARCLQCGFEAPAGGDEWASVDHPPLGELTQCPECASTDILTPG